MGGQNHQPTKTVFTAVSAWLSQRVGQGFALVLEANNYLEDAIMLGMDKLHVDDLASRLSGTPSEYLGKAIMSLERSEEVLGQIQTGFKRLLDVAGIEGYTGNPLAPQLDTFALLSKFEGTLVCPFTHSRVWRELEQRIKSDNILKTLEWEAAQFGELSQPTRDLILVMKECLRISEAEGGRAVVDSIEKNELPLRQYYAQVFSLWNTLHAMFLYSALIMTELFYRVNAYPSLLDFDPIAASVHAA